MGAPEESGAARGSGTALPKNEQQRNSPADSSGSLLATDAKTEPLLADAKANNINESDINEYSDANRRSRSSENDHSDSNHSDNGSDNRTGPTPPPVTKPNLELNNNNDDAFKSESRDDPMP
jgi:hypothetical protein